MDKLHAMSVFVQVAEHGGFTAASRSLDMTVSAVTKSVMRLEDELGVLLFNRSTRRLNITDYGREYYNRCVRILADLEEAELALQREHLTAQGEVRVLAPISFGRVTLVPALPEFFRAYPDIKLELQLSDSKGPSDMLKEGIDVAVIFGHLSDSSLISRVLMHSPFVAVASPRYLEAHGTPKTPKALKEHNCISVHGHVHEWHFKSPDGEDEIININSNISIDSGDAYRESVVAGLGIGYATRWLFRKDFERGDVVPLLTDYQTGSMQVSVLFPQTRYLPKKARVFIDFLISITRPGE